MAYTWNCPPGQPAQRILEVEAAVEGFELSRLSRSKRPVRRPHVPLGNAEVLKGGSPEGERKSREERDIVTFHHVQGSGGLSVLTGVPKKFGYPRRERREGAVVGLHAVRLI